MIEILSWAGRAGGGIRATSGTALPAFLAVIGAGAPAGGVRVVPPRPRERLGGLGRECGARRRPAQLRRAGPAEGGQPRPDCERALLGSVALAG
jgi:hypothetical protein